MFHIGQCLYHRNSVHELEYSILRFSHYGKKEKKKMEKKKVAKKRKKKLQNDHVVRFAVRFLIYRYP